MGGQKQVTIPADAGPIVFLNPAVLLPMVVPTVGPDGFTMTGVRNAAPQINGSADRLNALFLHAGAAAVLTTVAGMGDVLHRLARIGFHAVFHPDSVLDPLQPDTGAGVADWLARHGNPAHALVDHPGSAPAVALRIGLTINGDVSAADCRAAAFALGATDFPFA